MATLVLHENEGPQARRTRRGDSNEMLIWHLWASTARCGPGGGQPTWRCESLRRPLRRPSRQLAAGAWVEPRLLSADLLDDVRTSCIGQQPGRVTPGHSNPGRNHGRGGVLTVAPQ